MYSEHLRSKLRAANVSHTDPEQQLMMRAASQINTYVAIINARLSLDSEDSSSALPTLMHTLARVETLAQSTQ